ncbi:MAG TPA: DPP IV N-terminal domain-containing protein, partial [Gillisia sp.]|nr:DPP IV N-terminal domain-containing protein [Gillisia sp.]
MKLFKFVLTLFWVGTTAVFAQDKKITLEEIYDGTFSQQRMESLRSMNNGTEYIVLNQDRQAGTTSIDVYDYKAGQKKRSLLNSADLEDISRFQGYKLSDNENKVLLGTEVEQIFRRSSRGIYFVYDVASRSLTKVSENKIQEPTFSPDASKVAFVFDNNIYIKDLSSGEETQVTTDGKRNEIINGVTDWVYEEEFSFVRAFDWNAGGNHLAFLRFDEVEVPEFSMDLYGADLYPGASTFKYPKAGEKNAEVSLHIYHLDDKNTTAVNLGDFEDFYIPRIKWTSDADLL